MLLALSNVFMTFAWYGHLKNLAASPWYIAALVSWGIALFEYLLQVPANRIGFQQAGFNVGQLKIMQGHHRGGVCAVCRVLFEGTAQAGFPLGRFVPGGCGVFQLPGGLSLASSHWPRGAAA